MPERVRLSRKKGAKIPPNTVSVARPTKWGNPYIGTDPRLGSRRRLVDAFRAGLLNGRLTITTHDVRRALRGKNLACWCPLDEPCHADVLLEVANS